MRILGHVKPEIQTKLMMEQLTFALGYINQAALEEGFKYMTIVNLVC